MNPSQIFIVCLLLVAPSSSTRASAHDALERQIAQLTAELERSPGNEALLIQRSDLYRLHEEWNASLVDLAGVRRLRRTQKFVLVRGRLLRDLRFLHRATREVDSYLVREPQDAQVRLLRAEIRELRGQQSKALADLDYVVATVRYPEPDHFMARARVAARCVELGELAVPRALAGLDEGLTRLGPVASLQLAAIDLELSRSEFAGALERLDTLLALRGRNERWLFHRGEILSLAGRGHEARDAYDATLAAIRSLRPRARSTPAIQVLERDVLNRLQEYRH